MGYRKKKINIKRHYQYEPNRSLENLRPLDLYNHQVECHLGLDRGVFVLLVKLAMEYRMISLAKEAVPGAREEPKYI